MKKHTSRREVDVDELDRIIDGAMREPLNETDSRTLKMAVHAMAERLVRGRSTEKTNAVLGDQVSPAPVEATQTETNENKPAGHGRNGASAYRGAEKVEVAHQSLHSGHRCPDCGRGNIYEQKEPKALVRISRRAPSVRPVPVCLEDELETFFAVKSNDRKKNIVRRLMGWDGGEGTTLEQAGHEFEYTRERIRQILVKISPALGRHKAEIPREGD